MHRNNPKTITHTTRIEQACHFLFFIPAPRLVSESAAAARLRQNASSRFTPPVLGLLNTCQASFAGLGKTTNSHQGCFLLFFIFVFFNDDEVCSTMGAALFPSPQRSFLRPATHALANQGSKGKKSHAFGKNSQLFYPLLKFVVGIIAEYVSRSRRRRGPLAI